MSMVGRAIMGTAYSSAFAYDDIPNQLLRIDPAQGFTLSGTNITAIADQSSAAETITITGAPQYTANNANLNSQPSFVGVSGGYVQALGVNRASVRFVVCVGYRPSTGNWYVWDGSTAIGRHYCLLNGAGDMIVNGTTIAAAGEPSTGRKRMLVPNDGATLARFNGTLLGSAYPTGSASGSGLTIGGVYTGGSPGFQVAFFMACSAVPSAPLRASLEANLLARFG